MSQKEEIEIGLDNSEIPEGIDPSVLAELPEYWRQEAIRVQKRINFENLSPATSTQTLSSEESTNSATDDIDIPGDIPSSFIAEVPEFLRADVIEQHRRICFQKLKKRISTSTVQHEETSKTAAVNMDVPADMPPSSSADLKKYFKTQIINDYMRISAQTSHTRTSTATVEPEERSKTADVDMGVPADMPPLISVDLPTDSKANTINDYMRIDAQKSHTRTSTAFFQPIERNKSAVDMPPLILVDLQKESGAKTIKDYMRVDHAELPSTSSVQTYEGDKKDSNTPVYNIPVPDDIDPIFLAAIPEYLRSDVISEHKRIQNSRKIARVQPIRRNHFGTEEADVAALDDIPWDFGNNTPSFRRMRQATDDQAGTNFISDGATLNQTQSHVEGSEPRKFKRSSKVMTNLLMPTKPKKLFSKYCRST